jgi:hypothetical protein
LYCLVSEKPLRLVYGTFYLAIGDTFYEFINDDELVKIHNSVTPAEAGVQKLLK